MENINKHEHKECEHTNLAYCKRCDLVYCKECGREWRNNHCYRWDKWIWDDTVKWSDNTSNDVIGVHYNTCGK